MVTFNEVVKTAHIEYNKETGINCLFCKCNGKSYKTIYDPEVILVDDLIREIVRRENAEIKFESTFEIL